MSRILISILLVMPLVAGAQGQTYTLYRDSVVDGLRIHFATFDADQTDPTYNEGNCRMAARLLTSNVRALHGDTNLNEENSEAGFWCEPGPYREEGQVPLTFEAEFPTMASEGDSTTIDSLATDMLAVQAELAQLRLELEYLKLDHFKYDEATLSLALEIAEDYEAVKELSGENEYQRVRTLREDRINAALDDSVAAHGAAMDAGVTYSEDPSTP